FDRLLNLQHRATRASSSTGDLATTFKTYNIDLRLRKPLA
ncbi:MAG: hypothetical protein RLZZ346_940, partial [Cyanobacteriota bacterium]